MHRPGALLAPFRRLSGAAAGRKAAADLALAFGAHLAFKAASYVVILVLARHLPREAMGAFFFTTSLATLFALVAELGTSTYLLRAAARCPAEALDACGSVLALRLALAGVYAAAINGFIALTRPEIQLVGLLVSAHVFLEQLYQSLGALFFGLRRVSYNAASGISAKLLLVALVVLVVSLGGSLHAALVAHIISDLVLLAVAIWLVQTRIGQLRLRWSLAAFAQILRGSLPFLLTAVLMLIHTSLGLLLLGLLSTYVVVAAYGAGARLLEATRFLVRPVVQVFLPRCAGLAAEGRWGDLGRLLPLMLLAAAGLGLAIALGVALGAELVISLVFGPGYADAAAVLRVLFLSAPAIYVGTVGTLFANAIGSERRAALVLLVGTVAHVLLAGPAIIVAGPLGAAAVAAACETAMAGGLTLLCLAEVSRRRGGAPTAGRLRRPNIG